MRIGKMFLTLTSVCPKLLVLGANCFMSNINGLPRIVEEGMDSSSLRPESYLRREDGALAIPDDQLNTVADVRAYRKAAARDIRREVGRRRTAKVRRDKKERLQKEKEARQGEEKRNEEEVATQLAELLEKTRQGEQDAAAAALVAQQQRTEQALLSLVRGGGGGNAGGGGGGGGDADEGEGDDMSEGGGSGGDDADGGEGGDVREGGGGSGGDGGPSGVPGGVRGGSMGDEDVSDEAIRDVLECAVFQQQHKRNSCAKRWCVVGLSVGNVHDIPSKIGRSHGDTKLELARSLVRKYGAAWREKFKNVDDG